MKYLNMEGMGETDLPEIEYNPEGEYFLQILAEQNRGGIILNEVSRVGKYNSARAREILGSAEPHDLGGLVAVDVTSKSSDGLVMSLVSGDRNTTKDRPQFPNRVSESTTSVSLTPQDVLTIRNSIKNALLAYFSEWFRYLTRLPRKGSNEAIEMPKRPTQIWKYTDDNFPYPVFYQLVRESESGRYGGSRILQLMFSLYEKKQLSINGNEKHLQFSLPPDIMNWLEGFEFDAFMTLYCEGDFDLDVFWEKRHFLWKPFLNVPVLRGYSRPVFTSKVLKPEIIERVNDLLKQACIQVVREVQSYQQSLE